MAESSLTAGLFFLRFWRTTGDRFFLFFAVAFGLEALVRVILGLSALSQESEPFIYGLRLLSYGCIIVAVVDKNRSPAEPPS
jgi:hypothetical protein